MPGWPESWGRHSRNAHLWLPQYLWWRFFVRPRTPPSHLWLVIADHFEPLWQKPLPDVAAARVARWREAWPRVAERHRDARGRPPVYSFFYPEEEYRPELLEPLAEMTREGIADVEVHLHHDQDTEASFVDRVSRFLQALHGNHGLLRHDSGKLRFGFIHGNWALDNARPDGRWCGLNNEITLLSRLGCYADFTMPAAPDPSQAGPVNVVYRVTDDPEKPRSYARGVVVAPGTTSSGDLTLIPGPLACGWGGRGLKPFLDGGEIASYARPSLARVRRWLDAAPRVDGHAFVKLFAHGAQERHAESLLGGDLDALFRDLHLECDRRGVRLHYVSAWEAFRAVEATREGRQP
jgi:hypothetical protein